MWVGCQEELHGAPAHRLVREGDGGEARTQGLVAPLAEVFWVPVFGVGDLLVNELDCARKFHSRRIVDASDVNLRRSLAT